MKNADHMVTATEASAYTHTKITEHSLSPTPNSCVIVPADDDDDNPTRQSSVKQSGKTRTACYASNRCPTDVHGGRDGVLQQEDELVQRVRPDDA